MEKMIIFTMLVLALSTVAIAHGDALEEGEEIIAQKIPCSELTEEQLEAVGDYYMEQMHPGEEHTRMDAMMGGEGSESLRNMHIRMAESMYCGQHHAMDENSMMMNGYMNSPQDGPNYYLITALVVLAGLAGAGIYKLANK